jgi:hypothetical protein
MLSPRLLIAAVLAVVLAFTHFFTYRAGKAIVRNEYATQQAAANADARRIEQRRAGMAIAAANNAVKREAVLRAGAAGALDAADRLRDELDLTQRFAGESADAAAKSIAALRAVFESCTKEYRGMAEIAQGHANDAMTLQEAWPE